MPRIRSIKPEFFTSEDICALTVKARLTYVGLWCHADREGRMKCACTSLAAQIMPYEMHEFVQSLNELIDRGLVVRYSVDSKDYLCIPTFNDHQRPHKTERDSKIPPIKDGELTVKEPLEAGESTTGKGKGKGKVREQGVELCKPDRANGADFERFWAAWPVKRNKKRAKDVFVRKKFSLTDVDELITDVEQRKKSDEQWKRGFIPHCSTYLNGERWEDQYGR